MRDDSKGTPVKIDEAAEKLIQAMVEQEVEDLKHEIDPYEGYVQRIRMHIHRNIKEFYTRFCQGYEALVEEIKTSSDQDSNQFPPKV